MRLRPAFLAVVLGLSLFGTIYAFQRPWREVTALEYGNDLHITRAHRKIPFSGTLMIEGDERCSRRFLLVGAARFELRFELAFPCAQGGFRRARVQGAVELC